MQLARVVSCALELTSVKFTTVDDNASRTKPVSLKTKRVKKKVPTSTNKSLIVCAALIGTR